MTSRTTGRKRAAPQTRLSLKILLISAVVVGLAIGVAGYYTRISHTTAIEAIAADVGNFTGESITVGGKVVETFTLPFVKTGAYQIDDGTGKLWVVRDADIPARGAQIKATGTIAVGIVIGGENLGTVLLEDTD